MPETASAAPRRVVVIAEDPLVRAALARLLAADERLLVVDQLAPRDDLGAALAPALPEVVVWDLGVGADSAEAAGALGASLPLVCLAPDGERAAELRALGVRGLVSREVDAARLCAAAAALAEGLLVFDESFADELFDERRTPSAMLENLTPRELEVLELVAEGLSNKLIAARLGISEHTAKFHVTAIMTKLGVQTRTEAVVRAARLGLLTL
jgi:DNA-binding NarL/FixJ family response regulator